MTTICDSMYLTRMYQELLIGDTATDEGGGIFRLGGVFWNPDDTVTVDETSNQSGFAARYWMWRNSEAPAKSLQGVRVIASVDAKTEGGQQDEMAQLYFRVFRRDGSRVDAGSNNQVTRVKKKDNWERLVLSFDMTEPDVTSAQVNFGRFGAQVSAGSKTAIHSFRNLSVTLVPIPGSYCHNTPYMTLYRKTSDYEFWWYPDGTAKLTTLYPNVTSDVSSPADGVFRSDAISYIRPFDFSGSDSEVINTGQGDTTLAWLACGDGGFRQIRTGTGTHNCRITSEGRWR